MRYGVIAIFVGAGLEGEPFALAGGVLAHRHWLSPLAATLASIGGACFVDQLWFHLSRHYRQSRFVQRVVKRPAFARALVLIERYPVWFVLLFRFAYGLRAVAPVAIGASRLSSRLFIARTLLQRSSGAACLQHWATGSDRNSRRPKHDMDLALRSPRLFYRRWFSVWHCAADGRDGRAIAL